MGFFGHELGLTPGTDATPRPAGRAAAHPAAATNKGCGWLLHRAGSAAALPAGPGPHGVSPLG